jgi:hypothetical protein
MVIQWDIPKDEISLFELFESINYGLIAILQSGILVWKHYYVEKDP